jgi:two-component system probable response regulator PhcQ
VKILLVDDDEVSLMVIEMFLMDLDHEVYAIQKPLKALELVENIKFDVVLTDYVMFDITGLELIQQIRNSGFTGKCILCSEILHDDKEKTSNICKKLSIEFVDKDMCSPAFKENIKRLII